MVKLDGTKNDPDVNPVVSLLMTWNSMSKNEIVTHIRDWWFGADYNKLFNDSVNNNIITEKDQRWSLTHENQPKKQTCPSCNGKNIAKIFWGYPADMKSIEESLERKEIVLGGCCVSENDPKWECNDCYDRWR